MKGYLDALNKKTTFAPAKHTSSSKQLYRVRKAWDQPKTQLGAFTVLEYAKKGCKPGYAVYDEKGHEVYSNKKSVTDIAREVIQGNWGNGAERKTKLSGAHEPIIDKDTFEKAQELLNEKKAYTPKTPALPSPFTKMLVCGGCGKNYRRRTTRSKKKWICPTYNFKGKEYCPTAKQIPEETLISVCCEVLGLTEFDDTVFTDRIEKIIVTQPNELLFKFRDGHEQTAHWKDRSRSESWTQDMREEARKNGSTKNTCKQKPEYISAAGQYC